MQLSLLAIVAFLLVRHVASLNIVWAGIAESEQEALVTATNLPENATKIEGEPTQAELLKQAAFLDVPLILTLICGLFYYRRKSKSDLRKPALLGCLCSILCMPVHELLHAISVPRGATSHVGIIKGNFSAYAFTDACMTLPQCVCYYLVPALVLGIIPLIISFFFKKRSLFWQVFLICLCPNRIGSDCAGLVWAVSRLERRPAWRNIANVRRVHLLVLLSGKMQNCGLFVQPIQLFPILAACF